GATVLVDARHDVVQRLISRHDFQNFLSRDGMRASPAAGVDRYSVYNLSVNSGFEAAQADVGRLMIAAARGTARPVNGKGIRTATHFVLERFGEGDRTGFGFDEGEIAIIRSDASDQSTQKGRRT